MAGFAAGMESVGSDKDGMVEIAGHGPSSNFPHPHAVPLVIGGGPPPLDNDEQVGGWESII